MFINSRLIETTMENYTVLIRKEGYLYILLWRDFHDILLTKNSKVEKSTYGMCV